jgi:hypothetical protein
VRTKGVALRKREERGSAAEGWERIKKGPEYEVKCRARRRWRCV